MKRSREPEEEPSSSPAGDDGPDRDVAIIEVPAPKIVGLDLSEEGQAANPPSTMRCFLPGHKEGLTFDTYENYAAHYSKSHTNRCLECRKNFPSSHLLDIHIEECHDAFVAAKREKGERTYTCFVEGCERKCSSPEKRRLHMIDKHMFPRNYFFAITQEGIDGRRSMLVEQGRHRRQSSSQQQQTQKAVRPAGRRSSRIDIGAVAAALGAPEGEITSPKRSAPAYVGKDADTEMDELTGAISALQFVPTSIRFGRREKVGFPRT
ncbi:Zinc finger protein [Pleurostoma richardsiae]|uniref:Zinc finger protein n=1 Tax=Pleurostoma richardsiae TaxID=41990 RepID=A0AA38S1A0_9PEZI|nr:Zinc finger protein [Pleurostoma richardsiae]